MSALRKVVGYVLQVLRLRPVRLPLDVVFLTLDLCRGGLWLVCDRIRKRLGLDRASPCPFQCLMDDADEEQVTCLAARKYGTLAVFRFLCPDLPKDQGEPWGPRCAGSTTKYRPSWSRMCALASGVVLCWALVGTGAVVAWERMRTTNRDDGPGAAAAIARSAPHPRGGKGEATGPPTEESGAQDGTPEAVPFVESADRYFAEGRYREARIEYLNAIQQDAENAEAHLRLGQCYLRTGPPATRSGPQSRLNANGLAARDAFREALALDSTMDEAHLGLAQIALATGDTKEALSQAQKATDLKPDDAEPRVLLAQCCQADRQPEAAAKEMDAAVALDSKNVEVLTAAATLYIFQKNLAKAERYCQQAFELDEANDNAQVLLASVLQAQGKLELARSHLDAILAREPQNVRARVALAEWHVMNRDLPSAIGEYERVLQHAPKHYVARTGLARLLMRSGRAQEAEDLAKEILRDRYGDADANLLLAGLYHARGLHSSAAKHCEAVLSTGRQDPRARVLLAKCYQAKGEYEHAARELERAKEELEAALTLSNDFREASSARSLLAEIRKKVYKVGERGERAG